ncbi:MAG TPA: helix-turn-helix transcriptional regulator [Longimicrobiales bacterium]|nr:helix-turn-helix transcriptional regulator [Longimicrobiales bacterium]
MHYRKTAPPPSLADHVRCIWTLTADAPPGGSRPEPVIPDGCAEVVLNLGDPYEALTAEGRSRRQPAAMIVGQITAALSLRAVGRSRLLGIRLQPWAGGALLGVPMADLRDGYVEASAVAPAFAALRERLGEEPTSRWAHVTGAFLEARVAPGPAPTLARAAVQRIVRGAGREPVEAVAAALASTPRSVERALREHAGLAPRDLRRIVRIQGAVRRLRTARSVVLGRIALEAGYYDQPHFCREFRRMAGLSPTEFLARERPLTEVFLAGDEAAASAEAAPR